MWFAKHTAEESIAMTITSKRVQDALAAMYVKDRDKERVYWFDIQYANQNFNFLTGPLNQSALENLRDSLCLPWIVSNNLPSIEIIDSAKNGKQLLAQAQLLRNRIVIPRNRCYPGVLAHECAHVVAWKKFKRGGPGVPFKHGPIFQALYASMLGSLNPGVELLSRGTIVARMYRGGLKPDTTVLV